MAFSAMSASESFSTRFPLKLWRLLNRCNSGAISWAEHGRSIKIDRRRFEVEYLMPVDSAFKTSNFSSFVRQLNLYGFRKVINTFRFNQSADTFGDVDIHEYHHQFFRKGHPDLLNRVQRRMKGRKNSSERQDYENESPSLVSSILKPHIQSTPKFEQVRFDRPALHVLDINGQLRPANFPQQSNPMFTPVSWSGCGSLPQPLPQTLISNFNNTSRLNTSPIAGFNHSPALVSSLPAYSMIRPVTTIQPSRNYTVQTTQPTLHPGLPVVEAIQQVLGEKTLSEMVLCPQTNGLSRYMGQPAPRMPVLNTIYTPPQTLSNSLSTISSESFLTHALNGQSAFSLKSGSLSPMFAPSSLSISTSALPTLCQPSTATRPLNSSTGTTSNSIIEIPALSNLPLMQDSILPHIVNICPPMQNSLLTNLMTDSASHTATENPNDSLSVQSMTSDPNQSGSTRNTPEPGMSSDISEKHDSQSQTIMNSQQLQVGDSSHSANTLNQFMKLHSPLGRQIPAGNNIGCASQTSLPDTVSLHPPSRTVMSNMNFPRKIDFPMVSSSSEMAGMSVHTSSPHDATHFLQRLSNGGFDQEGDQESSPSEHLAYRVHEEEGCLDNQDFIIQRIKLELP